MTAIGWRKRQIAELEGLDTSGKWMNPEAALEEINNAINETALECIQIVQSFGDVTFPQEHIKDAIKQKFLE